MKRIIALASIILLAGIGMASARDINGFDGFPWGSDPSIINSEMHDIVSRKDELGGRVTVVSTLPDRDKKLFGSVIYRKNYIFADGFGLCAGEICIHTSPGLTQYNFSSVWMLAQAVLGENYGFPGDRGRVDYTEWRSKNGHIFLREGPRQTVEIDYKSNKYQELVVEYQRSVAASLEEKGQLNGFKF